MRNDGVETSVVGDTLLFDLIVSVGLTYEYMGYHIDLNGNPSDTATRWSWPSVRSERDPAVGRVELGLAGPDANGCQWPQ